MNADWQLGEFEVEREQESASAATPKRVGSGRNKMGPETQNWARHEPQHPGTTLLLAACHSSVLHWAGRQCVGSG